MITLLLWVRRRVRGAAGRVMGRTDMWIYALLTWQHERRVARLPQYPPHQLAQLGASPVDEEPDAVDVAETPAKTIEGKNVKPKAWWS